MDITPFLTNQDCKFSGELSSNHGKTTLVDIPPESQPSAPMPSSRTSSRSTSTPATDTDASIIAGQLTQQTREQEDTGLNPGPSTQKAKRARSPEDSDGDDDDEYLPRKRARLSRSSTRSIRAVQKSLFNAVTPSNESIVAQKHSMSSVAAGTSDPPSLHRLAAGIIIDQPGLTTERPSDSVVIPSPSEPIQDQGQGQSHTRQATLRRRPIRTASAASLSSGAVAVPSPSEPTQDQGQGQSHPRQTTLRRRPTRTASAASLSRASLAMTRPPVWFIQDIPTRFSHIAY